MPVICALMCKTYSTWLRQEGAQHKLWYMFLFLLYLRICTLSRPWASASWEQLIWGSGRRSIFRGPGFAQSYGWPQGMSWNYCTTYFYLTSPVCPANADIKTALHCYHPYSRINISQRVCCCRVTVSPWSWTSLRLCLEGNAAALLPDHLFPLSQVKAEVG